MAGKKDNTITLKACDDFKQRLGILAVDTGAEAGKILRTCFNLMEETLRKHPWLIRTVEDRVDEGQ